MTRLAVVTVTFDEHWELAKYTHPILKAYAEKINADFVVIKDRKYPNFFPQYEKFQIPSILNEYDRICYIDTDAIVKKNTPDLFQVVPEEKFGIVDERQYGTNLVWTDEAIARQYLPYGFTPKIEHNTGVMIFSRLHRDVFENPLLLNTPYYDQPWINIQLEQQKVDILELPHTYNYSPLHLLPSPELAPKLHILHYAGGTFSHKLWHVKTELGIA